MNIMDPEKKDRWIQLCELASKEQNLETLLQLVQEINRLLDERDQTLKMVRNSSSTTESASS